MFDDFDYYDVNSLDKYCDNNEIKQTLFISNCKNKIFITKEEYEFISQDMSNVFNFYNNEIFISNDNGSLIRKDYDKYRFVFIRKIDEITFGFLIKVDIDNITILCKIFSIKDSVFYYTKNDENIIDYLKNNIYYLFIINKNKQYEHFKKYINKNNSNYKIILNNCNLISVNLLEELVNKDFISSDLISLLYNSQISKDKLFELTNLMLKRNLHLNKLLCYNSLIDIFIHNYDEIEFLPKILLKYDHVINNILDYTYCDKMICNDIYYDIFYNYIKKTKFIFSFSFITRLITKIRYYDKKYYSISELLLSNLKEQIEYKCHNELSIKEINNILDLDFHNTRVDSIYKLLEFEDYKKVFELYVLSSDIRLRAVNFDSRYSKLLLPIFKLKFNLKS